MAEQRGLVVSMVGDCLIQHHLSVYDDDRFLKIVNVLRESDVSIGNLECAIHTGENSPAFVAGGGRGGGLMAAPPFCLEELQWFGLDAVWAANNHSADLGEGGIVTTLDHLDAVGMAHAGTGRNLTEATVPAYVDTPKGRIAIISASDWGPRGRADLPYPIPFGVIAADQGSMFAGRPGVNLLRYDAVIHVEKATLDALRHASTQLGWEHQKGIRRRGGARDEPLIGDWLLNGEQDSDAELHFMGTKFVQDDVFSFETVPYEQDLERNYKWIREARRQADVVIVGLHQQGASRDERESTDHTRIFARGAIDAGADVFVAHGRGRIGGVEPYAGKAIIHGLPGFIRQREQIRHVPQEHLDRWNLPHESTAGEFLEARDEAEAGGSMPPGFQRTAVYTLEFDDDMRIKEARVYPGEMTKGSRAQSGRPLAAEPGSEMESRVLDSVIRRSAAFGAAAEVRDGVAVVRVN